VLLIITNSIISPEPGVAQVSFVVLWHTGVIPSWIKFLLVVLHQGKGLISISVLSRFTFV